ncbi:hypothetical protein EON62_00160 [archaeon]|nr:MAG: hypothetical protein EON62_00160 [archaeon]
MQGNVLGEELAGLGYTVITWATLARDSACAEFSKHFYRALENGKTFAHAYVDAVDGLTAGNVFRIGDPEMQNTIFDSATRRPFCRADGSDLPASERPMVDNNFAGIPVLYGSPITLSEHFLSKLVNAMHHAALLRALWEGALPFEYEHVRAIASCIVKLYGVEERCTAAKFSMDPAAAKVGADTLEAMARRTVETWKANRKFFKETIAQQAPDYVFSRKFFIGENEFNLWNEVHKRRVEMGRTLHSAAIHQPRPAGASAGMQHFLRFTTPISMEQMYWHLYPHGLITPTAASAGATSPVGGAAASVATPRVARPGPKRARTALSDDEAESESRASTLSFASASPSNIPTFDGGGGGFRGGNDIIECGAEWKSFANLMRKTVVSTHPLCDMLDELENMATWFVAPFAPPEGEVEEVTDPTSVALPLQRTVSLTRSTQERTRLLMFGGVGGRAVGSVSVATGASCTTLTASEGAPFQLTWPPASKAGARAAHMWERAHFCMAATPQRRVFLIGGMLDEQLKTAGAVFDVDTGRMESNVRLNREVVYAAAASVRDGADVLLTGGRHPNAGGSPASQSQRCYFLNTTSLEWREAPAFIHARCDHALAVSPCGQVVYAVGGMGADGLLRSVERLDLREPAPAWTLVRDLPEPVSKAAALTDSHGRLYVLGGIDDSGEQGSAVWRLDVSSTSSVWTCLPPMLKRRRDFMAISSVPVDVRTLRNSVNLCDSPWAKQECIVVAGGCRTWLWSARRTMECYSIANGTWFQLPSMPVRRGAFGGALFTAGDATE